jgi:hypothetical protein
MAATRTNEVSFDIHIDKGDVTGLSWHGTFSAKPTLSFSEQMKQDRLRRELIGPMPEQADLECVAQAVMLADLSVRIVEAPAWWGGGMGHSDTNLLEAVWNEIKRIVTEHRKAIEEKGQQAQQNLRTQKE